MRQRRKPYLSMAAFVAFFGLLAFYGVASNPRFETIHVLDVIRLMTAGAAVAVTLVMLVSYFAQRTEDKRAGEKSGEESK